MNHTDITPHIIPRRQWLVAYVQSCLEKKTAERLKAMGVEYYLPIQSEIRQWSDRRKKVDRLVIPMMIFVHVTPQERPLPLTLQAISRYMVLRGESRPAVIPEEQMERFRFMLDYSPEAVEICSTPLAAGDAVKVIKGPLAGLEGELVMIDILCSNTPLDFLQLLFCTIWCVTEALKDASNARNIIIVFLHPLLISFGGFAFVLLRIGGNQQFIRICCYCKTVILINWHHERSTQA